METIQDGYSNDRTGISEKQKTIQDMSNEQTQETNNYAEEIKRQMEQSGNTKITDVFANPELDLGFGTDDQTVNAIYPQARTLTWNLQRIEAVMRADPFFVRALEYRSAKPIIKGIDISSDEIDAERISDLQKKKEDKIDTPIKEALFEADAFGWSGLLILVDGHMNKTKLKQPLKPEDIKKGNFLGLKPLTRWYQINPTKNMINKLGESTQIYDPRLLGEPLYYKVSFGGEQDDLYDIHRSRLLITSRNRLSYIEKKVEHYGGTSILEQAFDSMSRYHSLVAQIHRLLQKAVVPVLKLDDLASAGLTSKKGKEMVDKKIDTMRQNLSSNNLFVIGNQDDLHFENAELNGLDNQLHEAQTQLCAALNTPPSELFYKKSAEDVDFNGFVRERQQFTVKPMYKHLLPILYKSEYGEEMPEYNIDFKPLEDMTTKEIAESRKINVEALLALHENNVLNTKSVQDSLSDIDSNPTDIFRNLDEEYRSHIESLGVDENYIAQQIRLATALNKNEEDTSKEKVEGKNLGGDQNSTKKPTPDVPVNKGKES